MSGPAPSARRGSVATPEGRYFGTQKFSAGSRSTICGFEYIITSPTRAEVPNSLAIDTECSVPGGTIPLRQFYAVELDPATGDPVLSLIRIERRDGTPVFGTCNEAAHGHPNFGPRPPVPPLNDADAWVVRLDRGDVTQVLSTLFFLCSRHTRANEAEHTALSQTIPAALRDKGVLDRLSRHPSPWVRDYARRLTDKPPEAYPDSEFPP